MSFLLAVLGALLVLEGIPYFAFPSKVKQWAALMQEVPDRSLRVMGIISMAAGILALYVIRFF
jgi:uncharacterized protein YjeT (DUF2065 family)